MRYLQLSDHQAQQLVHLAINAIPNEICGLIAGSNDQAKSIMPITNAADVPEKRFFMQPSELLRALKQINDDGQELLAIYHSHPKDDPIPSQSDIRETQYPDAIHLIISLKYQTPRLQAWQIHDMEVSPVEIVIGAKSPQNEKTQKLTQFQKYAIVITALLAFLAVLAISITLLPPAPTLPITGS